MKKTIILINSLLFSLLCGQSYSLEECVQMTLKNKVTVESAKLDVVSAIAGKKAALSGILPSLSISGSASDGSDMNYQKLTFDGSNLNFQNQTSDAKEWNNSVILNQPIYDGGNTWRNLTLGKNLISIAEESERLTRTNVILSTHRSYFKLLKNQQLLASAQEDLALADQQLELVNHQFELGAVKKTDVLKARVRLGQAKTSVIIQNSDLDNAKRELANVMGVLNGGLSFTIKDIDAVIPEAPDFDSSLKIMESKNPSLIMQDFTVNNQELSYKNAKGSRLPSLSLSGRYNTSAGSSSDLFSDPSDSWSGQITLSYPIFTGFQSSVLSQQAKIDWRTAQNDKTNVRDDFRVQLQAIIDGLENYKEIIPVLEEVRMAAEEDLKLAQERYALGATTILEVLDAQLSVTRARTDLINTTYDALAQDATLKATLGVLDSEFK
ncbi:MAG: TolC family protein [Candidatus Marinimicrobia bacterium]|nr:TolC family protein [Candidatus Neomarinimicrobiota bacterium]